MLAATRPAANRIVAARRLLSPTTASLVVPAPAPRRRILSARPPRLSASRTLTSTSATMAPSDPYTAKAEQGNESVPASQKFDELRSIIKETKFGLLVSRNKDGHLHSRAMSPASHQGLVFSFIANEDSGKFDELDHDDHVNISFSDPSSTDWASVAGKARVTKDEKTIKELWNPLTKSWFGDLKDGVHTGEPGDPRIAIIQVVPDEIRYWIKNRTSLGQTVEVIKGAVTGETAAPGHLRTITSSELELARQVEGKA